MRVQFALQRFAPSHDLGLICLKNTFEFLQNGFHQLAHAIDVEV